VMVDSVVVTEDLGADLAIISNTVSATGGSWEIVGNVLSWTGQVAAQSSLDISFQATLDSSLSDGVVVTNTALIAFDGVLLERSASTQVDSGPHMLFLPFVHRAYPVLRPSASRPNSSNQWLVTWDSTAEAGLEYELQESHDPTFLTFDSYDLGGASTVQITQNPSPYNSYYYRVRPSNADGIGQWSGVLKVVGAYHDKFDYDGTGWDVRRTSLWVPNDPVRQPRATYIVNANQTGMIDPGVLELMMNDRWDWFLASPMAEAPLPPYVVEWRSENQYVTPPPPNLNSHGAIIGGDWNGEACPEIGNVYQTTNCFNHFYNFNIIYKGSHKLLFERVDKLVWCPDCGGSALKRRGETEDVERDVWFVVENITGNEPNPFWHTYNVEVRSSGLRFYVDGVLKATSPDNRYLNERFFGLFASTDEYKPAHWYVDYYKVTPLDN